VIRMTETGMTLIKNGQSKQTIDWTGIQTLKINKRLISFVLKPGNTPRGVVIGKYGFSVDAWETLQDRIKFHFNANKRM